MTTADDPTITWLVTGFGPFGDHEYNPSGDAAEALAATLGTSAHLLDVTYGSAAQFANAHLRASSAGAMTFVHLGLGANRDRVCFEHRAANERHDRPDRRERRLDAELPGHQPLVEENRDLRTTGLDLASMVDRYQSRRPPELPPACISDDCGRFVCNAIYYHSLRACERASLNGRDADALFIHIPSLSGGHARRLGEYLAGLFDH